MEPFKSLLNPALVRAAAERLHAVWPAFDKTQFVRRANRGLEALELKARAMQIADALAATLPEDFNAACNVIEASLAQPVEPGDEPPADAIGLRGWIVWPLGEFVARRGLQHPERSFAALHALTQRSSAEFAIRPFIVEHPALALATLRRWACDPSPHVRRLASEGSRPRLPWGAAAEIPGRRSDPDAASAGCPAGRPERVCAAQRGESPERHREGPSIARRRLGA